MLQSEQKRDVAIGILGSCCALMILFLWIPNDVDTGVVDVWRRTVRIGDAMLPTFAAYGILIASIGIMAQNFFIKSQVPVRAVASAFIFSLFAILTISLLLMLVTGPVCIWLWTGGEMNYRQVLASAPWKYLGFLVGGTLMVFGFISLSEHQIRWRNVGIAVLSTILIALLYDLPFDSLFLPPNGDF